MRERRKITRPPPLTGHDAGPRFRNAEVNVGRLKERLEARGLPMRQVSLAIGMPQNFVKNLMSGASRSPSPERLQALADELKCSPDYLLGLTPILDGARPAAAIPGFTAVEGLLAYMKAVRTGGRPPTEQQWREMLDLAGL